MPCLSITCPVAAVTTANSSSATLAMVMRCLLGAASGLAGRASWRSGDPRQATSTSAVSFVLTVGTSRPSGLGRRFGRGGGRLEPGTHRVGLEIEIGVTANPVLVQPVLSAGAEHAEAVPDAPAQVD